MLYFSTLQGDVTWPDDSLFNGYAVVSLIPPVGTYGNSWASLFAGKVQIPLRTKITIVEGVFSGTGILYNSCIAPPNSQYVIRYYDNGGNLVGSPDSIADAFIISSETTSPPIYIQETSTLATELPEED